MKMSFSLHFKYLMSGFIILFPLVLLLYEISANEEILFSDIGDLFDELEGFEFIFGLFFIFISYAVGAIIELISLPHFNSSYISKRLTGFMRVFTKKDFVICNSKSYKCINRIEDKESLSNAEVYQYMISCIYAKNENLTKEIQTYLFRIHILMSLILGMIFLLVDFSIKTYRAYDDGDEFLLYSFFALLFLGSILIFYRLKKKCYIGLLSSIERAYYILHQKGWSCRSGKDEDTDATMDFEI